MDAFEAASERLNDTDIATDVVGDAGMADAVDIGQHWGSHSSGAL